jgi:beta-lactam-binding protein with PASTA domain
LNYLVVDSIFIRNHKPGSIYESTPPAGTHVKPGRTIYLTINAGTADLATVPSVLDMSQRQATAMLTSQGFASIKVKSVPGAYKDLVTGLEDAYGKSIRPGTQWKANSTVVLLVGSGNDALETIDEEEIVFDETFDETFN